MTDVMPGMLPSEAFTGRWRSRQNERQRAKVEFGPWALAVPEPDVGALDMKRFPYQREILFETGELPECICAKGTQVGMSTTYVRWALWVGEELKGRCIYVMPTQDLADAFSDDRVKRLMEQPALRDRIPEGGTQNKRQKRIGVAGLVYFRGSMQETSLDNIPARGLVLDEYDTLNQANIPVVEQRVGAQDDPLIRRLGVPTLQGIGIHRMYRGTDMRQWFIKCAHCGHQQTIKFENLRGEQLSPTEWRAWRVCVKCEKEVENVLRGGAGEWVAEHPDRPTRGYHIPRLIVPFANMGKIMANSKSDNETALQNHYNRDRAEPFETPDQRLSEPAITSCRRDGIHYAESYVGFNPVTMGIDQAASRPLTVRISEHISPTEKRTLALLEIPVMPTEAPETEADAIVDTTAIKRLGELMAIFKVQMAVIDHLPDGIFARTFCAQHRGRAYMGAFNTSYTAKESIVVPPINKPMDMLVTVKRSEWIEITLNAFRHQRNLLPKEQPLPASYVEELRNAIKKKQTDRYDREFYVYETAGPVDWLMAELYDAVATETLKRRLMEGAVAQQMQGREVQPERPMPNPNDWDTKPWENRDPLDVARGTYGDEWNDDYRP